MKTEFTSIEAWALPNQPGKLAFFETIALMDLEEKWIRMDAKTQRAILGGAIFGRQEFRVSKEGTVEVRRSACFGTEKEIGEYSAEVVDYARQHSLRLSPGVFGKGYYRNMSEQ